MNMGLGFSEILLIVVLILIFFGSKEIPRFVREISKFFAYIRTYSDKVRRELDTLSLDIHASSQSDDFKQPIIQKKNELRTQFLTTRKGLTSEQRSEKSKKIWEYVNEYPDLERCKSVMVYIDIGAEVETRGLIKMLQMQGKRIIIPYTNDSCTDIGIGEIKNLETDLIKSNAGTIDPKIELRNNFFKSDIQFVICPGVAFDTYGGRLGRGKSCYDRFLKELKGKVPIVGLAFSCQICQESLPFDYHDVPMDQVITEDGYVLPMINYNDETENIIISESSSTVSDPAV